MSHIETVTKYNVPSYASEWMQARVARKLSKYTLTQDCVSLQTFNRDLSHVSLLEIETRLAELSRTHKTGTMRRMTITIKQVLSSNGRDEIANKIKLPKPGEHRVVVYSKEDVQKLLAACTCVRDRLLIETLVQLGPRRGELDHMRIKDVQFDQYSPIIWLRGKSGTRTRRLHDSAKDDLVRYLNEHPHRNDPDAKFWLNAYGEPLTYDGIYQIVLKIGMRALGRRIFPHGFRHTAATYDAGDWTDRQMMQRFGWKTPFMVSVYAHLSGRDVDEKDLIMHGLKSTKDAREPLIETRVCSRCQAQNGPVAVYCQKCGVPFSVADQEEQRKELNASSSEIKKLMEKNLQLEARLRKQDQFYERLNSPEYRDELIADLRNELNKMLKTRTGVSISKL